MGIGGRVRLLVAGARRASRGPGGWRGGGGGGAGVMWAGAVVEVRSRAGRHACAEHFLKIRHRAGFANYRVISSLYTLAVRS
jgi:hypothetical protein